MSNKMYVGNLPFSATEDDLRSLFSEFGQPTEVAIAMDRETGRPRGFGFVTMDNRDSLDAAIRSANGRDFQGRTLTVNEARERESRPPGSGSGKPGGARGDAGRVGGDQRRGSV